MSFRNGKRYTIKQLSSSHHYWSEVQKAVRRRAKSGTGNLHLAELYDVRWRKNAKPFPWSWTRQFKPERRFFYHGTQASNIPKILDEGFQLLVPTHGRMLGPGIYATYHTNKGQMYGTGGYVISVMVFAPRTHTVHAGQTISSADIQRLRNTHHAIEVRTGAVVQGWTMQNHEICVFDIRRVVPRFLVKIT